MARVNSTTFLLNASTRHGIYVQRFAGSQIRQLARFLTEARNKAVARISEIEVSQSSREQLKALVAALNDDLKEIYKQFSDELKGNMAEFGDYEAEFSAKMFKQATDTTFKVPASSTIAAAALQEPLLLLEDKLSMEKALSQFSSKKRREVSRLIRQGVVAGKTSQELTRDVTQVMNSLHKYQAASLVRTVVNHVSTQARNSVIADNSDVIEEVEWVSVLDGSTTFTCQSLDGQRFPINEGPRPPQHWGCRSTVVPVVKEKYRVFKDTDQQRPAVGADGVENVGGRTDYNSWLKRQPASFQNEVLGPQRAKLFREGGLSVDSFVDKNYKPITLDQLKRKEPMAFDKAGLL